MTEVQFSKIAEFYAPTKTVFGIDAASRVGDEVKSLGGTKVLVVTDKVLRELDVIRPVLESLRAASIPYIIFDEVLPNTHARLLLQAFDVLQSAKCDLVMGVGGGSPMDTAKVVSLMVTNGSDIMPFIGVDNVKKPGIPKITVPTTNVAGADTSFAAVLTINEETQEHGVILSHFAMPDVVIIDPLLTMSMPRSVTADTGVDVLATAIEAYISPMANLFSDILGEKVIELCGKYLPIAYATGSNIEARYHMAFCANVSGPLFMNSSIGAIHALARHVADELHLPHGRSLASIITAVMRYNICGCPERFAKIATLLGKSTEGLSAIEGAELAVKAVEDILDIVEVPHRLRDYGVLEKDIPRLAEASFAGATERLLRGNPRDLTAPDVEAIFKAAF